MKIQLDYNLTVDDYFNLRKSVGWNEIKKEQVEKGLKNKKHKIIYFDVIIYL